MAEDDGIVHDNVCIVVGGEDEFDVVRDGWGEPKLRFNRVPFGVYA